MRFRHEGAIGDKLDDAKRALGLFTKAREGFEQQSHALNAKTMKREELMAYWLEVYTATLDEIPANPVTTEEKKREQNAKEILARWAQNFDSDRAKTGHGASAWVALNAVTQWFDHQRTVRAPNESARAEGRAMSNLWGPSAAAKAKAVAIAIQR